MFLSTVSLGKSFLWVFCLALAPLCVWFAVFALTIAFWLGICGSSCCFGWFLFCCDLPALLDLLGPCTNVVFDRLCSCKNRATVRHRPYPRKKKSCVSPSFLRFACFCVVFLGCLALFDLRFLMFHLTWTHLR